MSPATERQGNRERRQDRRFVQFGELGARQLSPLGTTKAHERIVRGRVKNVSAGGICMLTDQLVNESVLLQCDITFANFPVATPALMEIQWIAEGDEEFKYAVGLRYLLVAPGSSSAP